MTNHTPVQKIEANALVESTPFSELTTDLIPLQDIDTLGIVSIRSAEEETMLAERWKAAVRIKTRQPLVDQSKQNLEILGERYGSQQRPIPRDVFSGLNSEVRSAAINARNFRETYGRS